MRLAPRLVAVVSTALLTLSLIATSAGGHATEGPFAQRIPADPVLHSQSASLVRSTVPDAPVVTTEFGTAIYRASETDPQCRIMFTRSWGPAWSVSIPVPTDAEPTGSSSSDPWGDHWLSIRHDGYQYDLWIFDHWDGTLCTNGKQLAHWGGKFALDQPLIAPLTGSGGGAGISVTAGTPRRHEILNDTIDHALSFAVENESPLFKYPAWKSDGDCLGGIPKCVKAGQRFYLAVSDAEVEAIADPYQRAIARALQQYGMFVTDQTHGVNFPLEQRSSDLLANYTRLTQIPWGSLRALKCADGTAECVE